MPARKYDLDHGEQRVPVEADSYRQYIVRNSVYRHARRRKVRVYTRVRVVDGQPMLVYGRREASDG